jgi:ABC-type lipoprotein release transport system permease subunit
MNLVLRLAWRNLWRQPRRTWLTTGAMVFSNVLLVFMISLQFGMYRLMIENSLQAFTGHMQVQAEGYKDDQKMRQTVPSVADLAGELRERTGLDSIAARASTFVLASSEERTYGIAVYGVEPGYEPGVSSIPGLVRQGRFLEDPNAAEIVIGPRSYKLSGFSKAACRNSTEASPSCRWASSRMSSIWRVAATR